VVGGSLQSIDRIHLHINREEVDLELLFEVPPGLDRENASVCFLTEYIFGPLGGTTTFEECEGPEDFLLFVMELLQSQADVERAGVQKRAAIVTFSTQVQRTGELGTCPSYCQSRWQRHWRRWYKQGKCVVWAKGGN